MGNEEAPELGRPPHHFQSELASLISESRAFAVAEDLDSISILLSDWLPSLRRLLDEASALLEGLEGLAGQAASGGLGIRQNWSRSTGTMIAPRAFEELSDLCFIALAECRASRRQLEPLTPASEPFTLLVVMERAQSRLSSSLCAVEARLALITGHESQTRYVDLGRKPLRARSLIARFRRRIASVAQLAGDDMERRMRSVGNGFAWLFGHDSFSSLRASDRLTARMLQERTLDWLRSRGSRDEGRRLWDDVQAFVELLRLINRRPEVVQHDFKIVLEVAGALADSDPHGPLPAAIVEPLNSILGRDEVLAEMLGQGVDSARVLARLLAVSEALLREGAAGGPDSGPPAVGPGGPASRGLPPAAGPGRLATPAAARPARPKGRGRTKRAVA